MAKFPDLNRLVRVSWGMTPLAQIIFGSNNNMCNCDITLTNAVQLSNKTMDYNENTFLNFPILPKNISSPANNDLLRYSSSDGKWHNVELVAGSNITVTQNANDITIAASSSGSTTLAGLTDVNMGAGILSQAINDGMPMVFDYATQIWKPAGYNGKQMTISASQFRFTKDNGTPIYVKNDFSNLNGSTDDIVTYRYPNGSVNSGNRILDVLATTSTTGKIALPANAPQAGSHTAAIGTLTGKPGANNVTDAAAWIVVTISSVDYAIPLFAL